MTVLLSYVRFELRLLLRNPEQLLLVLAIPTGLLVFFGTVDVLPDPTSLAFLVPGILSLAVLSSTMTGLGIATGFQRSSLALKRLGATPLGSRRLVLGKSIATGAVVALQLAVLGVIGFVLGWRPDAAGIPVALFAAALGGLACAGIGIGIAGRLRAEVTLAALNALYLLLLLASGFVLDTVHLPGLVAAAVEMSPATAMTSALRDALSGATVDGRDWIVLASWAVVSPLLAARTFRWDAD
jgi:ABC-2 type transport system permease protein